MTLDEQLASLVRVVVREELEAVLADRNQTSSISPALLDRQGIASALGVSAGTVDKLRRDGLPCIMVGDSPRFETAACLEWLRARRSGARSA